MPPQTSKSASQPTYTNEDIVKVLGSKEFNTAPPETQKAIREALGVPLDPGGGKPHGYTGSFAEEPVSAMDWLLGSFGPKREQFQHKGAIESSERMLREKSSDIKDRALHSAALGKEVPRHAEAELGLNTAADILGFLRGSATPKNTALAATATFIPPSRPIIGAYGVLSGLSSAAGSRKPDESVPDYLQRVFMGLGSAAGSGALVAGGFKTNAGKLEQRIKRADFASGATPGGQNAFRIALPDIVESIKHSGVKINTVADVARAVERTNERFNAQMALAEQPFAGDQIIPQAAADALRAAADDMAPSQAHEAALLRKEASNWEKPMTLRELGREVRHQNSLYGSHGGKTSLELSTAKTRSSVAINDILRKSLRDTYVDYLESKYPGSHLRDMRMRQEQVLKLREQLGTYNPKTGAIEKGHVEALKAKQSAHEAGPSGDVAGAVATPHGARGYLRLPKSMRAGPETIADAAAKKAFREGPLRGPLPRRALPKLKAAPGSTTTPPAGSGGGGLPPAPKPTAPKAGPLTMKAPKPTPKPAPVDVETYTRHVEIPNIRTRIREAQASGNQSEVSKWEGELEHAQNKLKRASKERAASALEKKHPEAAARLRKGMHIVNEE